ncbi:mitochondrial carrier [Marasmius fiardii PR-910]|nr:mitochondrial carrier [Marasmius fiardii PR-910]
MQIGLFDYFAIILSIAISLAIFVPLTGVLVRFRANYNPKGLQLDAEGGAQPHTGPMIQSYFGMMKRVYNVEGVNGLYKGFMPTFLSTAFVTALIIAFMDTPKATHGKYSSPDATILGTLFYSTIMMLVALPTAIITYRSITTPLRLPWLNATKSLRVLLTPTERRRPWILYLTPGLLTAEVSHIIIVVMGLNPLRRLLLPSPGKNFFDELSYWKLGTFLTILASSTAVLTPLEVIATRLAIQRNHSSSEYNSVSQEITGDAEEPSEFAGTEEDVIGLRNEEDPYLGLVDCAKRIAQEEGWKALYRAWWITFLGTFGSVISF